MNSFDRRKTARLKKILPIEFTFGDVGITSYEKIVLLLYSVNISGSGIMVISNVSLKEGSIVYVGLNFLKIPEKIKSKVIWNNPAKIPGLYEMGLEFQNVENRAREVLLNFIERNRA